MRDMTTKELIIMAGPNRPRHYEEEFKRQIVQLYENGKPSSQISAEYGIPRSTLQRWVQGIRNSGSTKAADNRTPEENELIELRKRNRQLEMEVDVSEQAAPVFCLCSISCCGFSHDDFSGLGRACRPRNGLNWMVLVSPPERTGKDYDQHAPSTVYPSFAAERGIRRVDRAENTCRRSRRCVSTSRRRICRPCRR